jgi:hypothetical protein
MFGICRIGIRELGIESSIATGDPFHAQSSTNSRTIWGFEMASAANEKPEPERSNSGMRNERIFDMRKCLKHRVFYV